MGLPVLNNQSSGGTPSVQITGLDIITLALRMIGKAGQGQPVQPEDNQVALQIVNLMLDTWMGERLTIGAVAGTEYPFVSGQQKYTLGPGGDFDQDWSDWLEASWKSYVNPIQPLEQALDVIEVLQWQDIPVKSVISALPDRVYFRKTFPLAELYFYPIPTQTNLKTVIYTPTPLISIALATPYRLRPAHLEAITYNLAVRLAPIYGVEASPTVMAVAQVALGTLKKNNQPSMRMAVDPALRSRGGYFDWRTGDVKR